tara:strand:- start:199 stop:618 length:420 start_codon:yes stop_codon:yes gene_type:complete
MKKCLAIIAATAITGCNTPAHATELGSRDHFKTVIKRTPYTVEVCSERKSSGDKTADTLMGAIIGGAIGQNITKDLPDGATAGAIIGGLLGHQNSTASDGTKLVCENMTRHKESMDTIYSHSTITFIHDGKQYTLRFNK